MWIYHGYWGWSAASYCANVSKQRRNLDLFWNPCNVYLMNLCQILVMKLHNLMKYSIYYNILKSMPRVFNKFVKFRWWNYITWLNLWTSSLLSLLMKLQYDKMFKILIYMYTEIHALALIPVQILSSLVMNLLIWWNAQDIDIYWNPCPCIFYRFVNYSSLWSLMM